MKRTIPIALALLLWVQAPPGVADLATARATVPNAELVGEGRLKVYFWKVFDASLYAAGGQYDPAQPFALSLRYLRSLEGRQIVDKSIDELAAQKVADAATLKRWRVALAAIIPDVDRNTTITGVRDKLAHTAFYRDGRPIGRIDDPAFTRAFFDIWLGSSTSEPGLRQRLINGSAS